jgi:hypothetical protein
MGLDAACAMQVQYLLLVAGLVAAVTCLRAEHGWADCNSRTLLEEAVTRPQTGTSQDQQRPGAVPLHHMHY